ncbi:MAG: DUF499 domain-containing protein [Planctomycetota bacterium]|nr:DUF499 domain-containing protein [Planctomycetota bacterium]
MALKPWHKVVDPREDLVAGRPLDASEFAVHLDQIRLKQGAEVYRDPERFFDRTYMTDSMADFGGEVVRRLSGEKTETNAIFHMVTSFGGGKTHALAMLWHLGTCGPKADRMTGVRKVLERARVSSVPKAQVAAFVGTEFDTLTGRGGADGTPVRKTPWGEIAFQLGGAKGFAHVAKHDETATAPAGDVIRAFLPTDKPCLILLDELVNFMSRNRKTGLTTQLYNFIQNLSETARGLDRVVVAVSIPSLLIEMTAEDVQDFERYSKLLDRVGKPISIANDKDTSEIIRRRLFEWDGTVPDDGQRTVNEYAKWVTDNRTQVPGTFPVDNARNEFEAAYPFHPTVLSVFERKWQSLPRFQRTRGILRLLALWVANASKAAAEGRLKDPLITLGTAPMDDANFRNAMFEQLGEHVLDVPVTTDICGTKNSKAERLDSEAVETIRKGRLHRKVASAIFFESTGGQQTAKVATLPELRLAVGEPDVDLGNIETVLDTLSTSCYYLTSEGNSYRFSIRPNLNKILADRQASVSEKMIQDRMRQEIQAVFAKGPGVERKFFPEQSGDVPDRPVLTFAILPPGQSVLEKTSLAGVERMTREHGASGRTFKSAVIWCGTDGAAALQEEVRKALAWEGIDDERDTLQLDESQLRKLDQNMKRADRDVKEAVWRAYHYVLLLDKNNALQCADMGLLNSSMAESAIQNIVNDLTRSDVLSPGPSPTFLVRHWPAADEWSTKAVRDAFFASPKFPRLLNGDVVRESIARGVSNNDLAYVGKAPDGHYEPFHFQTSLLAQDVELSDDMFIIKAEVAKRHVEPPKLTSITISPENPCVAPGKQEAFAARGLDQHGLPMALTAVAWSAAGGSVGDDGVLTAGPYEGCFSVTASSAGISASASYRVSARSEPPSPQPTPGRLVWSGEVPAQKWTNFYMKVLSKFASDRSVSMSIRAEITVDGKVSPQKLEETKTALRELGMSDNLSTG